MASTFTSLLYHLVFSTKERQPIIDAAWRDDLCAYIGGILAAEGGKLLCAGGVSDHVHLVVLTKASRSVSQTVGTIKANSSKWVNETCPLLARFEWQRGYAAFSIGLQGLPTLRSYIAQQEKHHSTASYREELVDLLERHGLDYDERFVLG